MANVVLTGVKSSSFLMKLTFDLMPRLTAPAGSCEWSRGHMRAAFTNHTNLCVTVL